MKNAWSRLSGRWCRLTHPTPMWPVQGHYRCPKCLRTHAVPWERPAASARPSSSRSIRYRVVLKRGPLSVALRALFPVG